MADTEIPTCPCCGLEFEDRTADEAVYVCFECGVEGFDCCVPGNHALCTECAQRREEQNGKRD